MNGRCAMGQHYPPFKVVISLKSKQNILFMWKDEIWGRSAILFLLVIALLIQRARLHNIPEDSWRRLLSWDSLLSIIMYDSSGKGHWCTRLLSVLSLRWRDGESFGVKLALSSLALPPVLFIIVDGNVCVICQRNRTMPCYCNIISLREGCGFLCFALWWCGQTWLVLKRKHGLCGFESKEELFLCIIGVVSFRRIRHAWW